MIQPTRFGRLPLQKSLPSISLILGAILLCWPARTLRSDNFIFYFPTTRHTVPLQVIQNTKYLPLLQVLNLVGKVNGLQEKRNTLQVRFGNYQINLRADDRNIRVEKWTVTLPNPIRISNGQWMVPVSFLTTIVPRLTNQAVDYHVGTNRVFIGGIKPVSFTMRVDQLAAGARLTFQFTDQVTVRTASANGKWVMYLGDRPVEPLESSFRFQNSYVSAVAYDDQDGTPKLIITPAADGLNFYPALAGNGKVLLAEILKPPPSVPQQPRPSIQPAPGTGTASTETPPATESTEGTPLAQTGLSLPVIALDPGHGGDDTGALGSNGVAEKDIVAQLAARVRTALLSTRKYHVILTRSGDSTVNFEQRAVTANVSGAIYFLTFHAGNLGGNSPRVAVYTYQPPSPLRLSVDSEKGLTFVPWNQIQNPRLDESIRLCQTVQQKLAQIDGIIVDAPAAAPIRTLRSINAPAVAIEIGSLTPQNDGRQLTNPSFQEQISTAVAQALESLQSGGA